MIFFQIQVKKVMQMLKQAQEKDNQRLQLEAKGQ